MRGRRQNYDYKKGRFQKVLENQIMSKQELRITYENYCKICDKKLYKNCKEVEIDKIFGTLKNP